MAYKFDIIRVEKDSVSQNQKMISPKEIPTTAPVQYAVFSPDEECLVLGMANKEFVFINLKTKMIEKSYRPTIPQGITISTASFSPYHPNLLIITAGNQFFFYDIKNGTFSHGQTFTEIKNIVFSPDKTRFVCILKYQPKQYISKKDDPKINVSSEVNILSFWQEAKSSIIEASKSLSVGNMYDELNSLITCSAFSSDGSFFVCGTKNNDIALFNKSGELLLTHKIETNEKGLKACAIFNIHKNENIVFLLDDNTFIVFNFFREKTKLAQTTIQKQDLLNTNFPYLIFSDCVVFSNDYVTLQKTSYDLIKQVGNWNANRQKISQYGIFLDENNSLIVAARSTVQKQQSRLSCHGKFYLEINMGLNKFTLYDLSMSSEARPERPLSILPSGNKFTISIGSDRKISWCKISPNGQYWVFGYGGGMRIFSKESDINSLSEVLIPNFPKNYSEITCVSFSQGNNSMAVGFKDLSFTDSYDQQQSKNAILVFNIQENFGLFKQLILEACPNFIYFLNPEQLFITNKDNSALTKSVGQMDFSNSLSIDKSLGKTISCNITSKNIKIIQEKSVSNMTISRGTTKIQPIFNFPDASIFSISNNGDYLLVHAPSQFTCTLYKQIETEPYLNHTKVHSGLIRGASFSPDNKHYVLFELQKITAWNIESRHELQSFATWDAIAFCQFSPSGREIIVGNESGTVDIYDISHLLPRTDIISLITQQLSLEQEGFIDYEEYCNHFENGHSFDYVVNDKKVALVENRLFRKTDCHKTIADRKLVNQTVRLTLKENVGLKEQSNELAFSRAFLMGIAHEQGLAKIKIPDFSLKKVQVTFLKKELQFHETWDISFELRYFKTTDITPKTYLEIIDISTILNYFSIHVAYQLTCQNITFEPETPVNLSFSGNLKSEEIAIKERLQKALEGRVRSPSPILVPPLMSPAASPQKAMPAEDSVITKIKEIANIIRTDE